MCIEARDGEDRLIIEPDGSKWVLRADPESRTNGADRYDGMFPKLCRSQSSAKSVATRFIG